MPRPGVSAKQQETRLEWKALFRSILEASPRPLGTTEIARVTTQVMQEQLGLEGQGVSPSQVSHWKSDPAPDASEGTIRVPASEEQVNALVYALSRLGAWRDENINESEAQQLVSKLGYKLRDLEDRGEFRWEIVDRALSLDAVFFLSAKEKTFKGDLEILAKEKARRKWVDFLLKGKRWVVFAGVPTPRYRELEGAERTPADWPYEFAGYVRAIEKAIGENPGRNPSLQPDGIYSIIRTGLLFAEVEVGEYYDRYCNPDSRLLLGVGISEASRLERSDWYREITLLSKDQLFGAYQHDHIQSGDGAAFGKISSSKLDEIWTYVSKKLRPNSSRLFCLRSVRFGNDGENDVAEPIRDAFLGNELFETC